jgi:hypothetical protein
MLLDATPSFDWLLHAGRYVVENVGVISRIWCIRELVIVYTCRLQNEVTRTIWRANERHQLLSLDSRRSNWISSANMDLQVCYDECKWMDGVIWCWTCEVFAIWNNRPSSTIHCSSFVRINASTDFRVTESIELSSKPSVKHQNTVVTSPKFNVRKSAAAKGAIRSAASADGSKVKSKYAAETSAKLVGARSRRKFVQVI